MCFQSYLSRANEEFQYHCGKKVDLAVKAFNLFIYIDIGNIGEKQILIKQNMYSNTILAI